MFFAQRRWWLIFTFTDALGLFISPPKTIITFLRIFPTFSRASGLPPPPSDSELLPPSQTSIISTFMRPPSRRLRRLPTRRRRRRRPRPPSPPRGDRPCSSRARRRSPPAPARARTVKQLIISYYCICMKIDTSGSSSEVRTKVRNKVRKYESTLYESTYFRTKVLPYFLPNT